MLSNKILKSVDPLIRNLVKKMNLLSFVDKTTFSCSGHWSKDLVSSGYIIIRYNSSPYFFKRIKHFHKALLNIPGVERYRSQETLINRLLLKKFLLNKDVKYLITPHYKSDLDIKSIRIKTLKNLWKYVEALVDKELKKDEK